MKYKISNKKAAVPIDEFIAFVVFVLVAFFAIFLFGTVSRGSETETRDNIVLQKSMNEAHNNLISFLQQRNNEVNMQEIITNSYYKNDYSQITQSITTFFNPKYSRNWAIIILDPANNQVLSVDPYNIRPTVATPGGAFMSNEMAAAYIPLNSQSTISYLKISLLNQRLK